MFGEIMQLIAGILIVILAAYYATYFLANKKRKNISGRGINVRERFALSKDKMVCVIEANGKAYLVVITNGGATLLETTELVNDTATDGVQGASPQSGYVPNGLIAAGIWKLFNYFRGATTAKAAVQNAQTAKSAPAKRGENSHGEENPCGEERSFSSVLEESGETPSVYVARGDDALRDTEEPYDE